VPDDVFEELFGAAEAFHQHFAPDGLTAAPTRHVAVLSCMDARLDLFRLLGLAIGDAHILRNAGGRATDDAIRSLVVSANWLGTRRALVIHHTGCGMLTLSDPQLREQLEAETGVAPDWTVDHPGDLDEGVRTTVAELRASPFLPDTGGVRGFVYEVETGSLREVR